jgi:23S rRNA (adenine2503-C2)-methyltransferase
MDKDLKNKTLDELEGIVESFGQKKYLAKYIFTFIHTKNVKDIADISTLSKAFREELNKNGFHISHLKTEKSLTDPDGTVKYLFELHDGNKIESVLLFDDNRKTVCVSTQAGCAMDCAFCATAKLKLRRNLTAAEIVDQINVIDADKGKINNIVFMGMGEPLNNYDAVLKAVRILNHPAGKNIGIRHITISTCGNADAILKLAKEDIAPRLAVSLNAVTDELRSKLMPVISKKYPIKKLLDSIKDYQAIVKQRITFEYVLIKDMNDSSNDAKKLCRIIKDIKCNVNLIEYNEHAHCDFQSSDRGIIKNFAQILTDAGIETVIRYKKGRDIKAACGQLGAEQL